MLEVKVGDKQKQKKRFSQNTKHKTSSRRENFTKKETKQDRPQKKLRKLKKLRKNGMEKKNEDGKKERRRWPRDEWENLRTTNDSIEQTDYNHLIFQKNEIINLTLFLFLFFF